MKTLVGADEPDDSDTSPETYKRLYTELMRRVVWTVSSPLRWVSKR